MKMVRSLKGLAFLLDEKNIRFGHLVEKDKYNIIEKDQLMAMQLGQITNLILYQKLFYQIVAQ